MANLLDPLIKSGVVPPESVFTPDFAKKYGGANDKILLMPGPTWYAKDIFGGTLKIPAGEMTAAMPLRWNSEPLTTGQVGGGPWVVSKHTKNLAAAIDFVKWVDDVARGQGKGRPVAGVPVVRARRHRLAGEPEQGPVLRRSSGRPAMKAAAALIWKGWSMVTYPDQPVWSNTVVTKLVAGQVAELLLPALGERARATTRRRPGTRS